MNERPSKHKPSRWYALGRFLGRGLLGIGLVMAAAVTLLYVLRDVTLAPLLCHKVVEMARSATGMEIEVGSIHGTYLGTLEIRDLRTLKPGHSGPLEQIDVARLEASFSLLGLLAGRRWLEAVRIEGVRVVIDLSRLPETPEEERSTRPAPPKWLPEVSLRDVAVELSGRGFTISAPALDGRIADEVQGGSLATLHLAGLRVETPDQRRENIDLRARLHYTAGLLQADRIDVNNGDLVLSGRVDARDLARELLAFDTTLEAAGGSLHASGTLEGRRLRGQCRVEDIDLEKISSLISMNTPMNTPAVRGIVDCEARIEGDLTDLGAARARLSLEMHDGTFGGLPIDRLALRSRLAGRTIHCPTLSVRYGRANRIRVSDARVPLSANLNEILQQANGTLSVDLGDLPALLGPLGVPPLPGREPPPHHLVFEAEAADGRVVVRTGRFETQGATVVLDGAQLVAAADPIDWKAATADAELGIAFDRLEPLGDLLGIAGLSGELAGTLAAHGPLGSLRTGVQLQGDHITIASRRLDHLRIEAEVKRSRVALRTFRLRGPHHDIRIHGVFRTDTRRLEQAGIVAQLDEIEEILGPQAGLSGKALVRATAQGLVTLPQADLSVNASDLVLDGTELGSLGLHLVNDAHRLTIDRAVLEGPLHFSAGGQIDHDLETGTADLALDTLELATRDGSLDVQGGGGISLDAAHTLRIDSLNLTGTDSELKVQGTVAAGGAVDLLLDAIKITPNGLLAWLAPEGPRLDEITELHARIRGSREDPVLGLKGEVRGLRVAASPPLDLIFDLDHRSMRTTIDEARVLLEGREIVTVSGSLPLDPFGTRPFVAGPLDLNGHVHADNLADLVPPSPKVTFREGRLNGVLNITGTWADPQVETDMEVSRLRIEGPDIPLPARPIDIKARAAYAEGEARLEKLTAMAPGTLSVNGSGKAQLRINLHRVGTPARIVKPGPLDATLELQIPDLAWLVTPGGPLRDASGRLDGEIRVTGTLEQPVFAGGADLSQAMLRLSDPSLGRFENLHGSLVLEEGAVRLTTLEGDLGAAPFQAQGTIAFDQPNGPHLDVGLQGKDILLFRRRGVKLRANTDLRIRGPLDELQVTGEVAVTDGCFVRNVDFLAFTRPGAARPSGPEGIELFSFPDPPLSTMKLDVALRSDKPFRIENNIVKGAVRPDLRLAGTGEVPLLLGTVYVDPTKIGLPSGTLRAPSGVIRFEEINPFVPTLDIPLEARLSGYDIQVLVTGSIDDPEIKFSSSPPLPQDDLLVLVTTGQAPRKKGTRTGKAAIGAVALYLGQDVLVRLLGSESTEIDESLLDRFEMETGRDVSESGTETIEARFRMIDNILSDNDSLYLQTERDEYEDFNMGFKLVFRFK